MASEEISHAIFASSHPAPLSTASSSTPPPTPRFAPHLAPRFAPHLAPRFAPHLALHFAPHLALHSHPASRLSCTPHPAPHHALHPAPRPPFPSLSLSQVSSSSHRQVPPSTSLHLPPVRQFPICVSPPSVSLSQAPPADFLVRKKAKFTHDMTFFHHDVRGKRFNTHGASHNMEMSSVKTTWQRSPGVGGTSGGMVAHDLVNGCQATA